MDLQNGVDLPHMGGGRDLPTKVPACSKKGPKLTERGKVTVQLSQK